VSHLRILHGHVGITDGSPLTDAKVEYYNAPIRFQENLPIG